MDLLIEVIGDNLIKINGRIFIKMKIEERFSHFGHLEIEILKKFSDKMDIFAKLNGNQIMEMILIQHGSILPESNETYNYKEIDYVNFCGINWIRNNFIFEPELDDESDISQLVQWIKSKGYQSIRQIINNQFIFLPNQFRKEELLINHSKDLRLTCFTIEQIYDDDEIIDTASDFSLIWYLLFSVNSCNPLQQRYIK